MICTSQVSRPFGMMASMWLMTGPREAHISSPVTKGWNSAVDKNRIVAAAVDVAMFVLFFVCFFLSKIKAKV